MRSPAPESNPLGRIPLPAKLATDCSLPAGLVAVLRELQNQQGSNFTRLARAIEFDPDLVAKIMGLARSAYCARREEPQTIDAAVRKLGRDVILSCVLGQMICTLSPVQNKITTRIVTHLFVVAGIARKLGCLTNRSLGDQAFIAGLLHDYGKLVLARSSADLYGPITDLCRRNGWRTLEAERALLIDDAGQQTDHIQVGQEQLRRIGLKESIINSVQAPHDEYQLHVSGWKQWDRSGKVLGLVLVADKLANYASYADGIADPAGAYVDLSLWYCLDQSVQHLHGLIRDAVEEVRGFIEAARLPVTVTQVLEEQEEQRRRSSINLPTTGPLMNAILDEEGQSEEGPDTAVTCDGNEQIGEPLPSFADDGGALRIPTDSDVPVADIEWEPDGDRLAVVFRDGTVRMWNFADLGSPISTSLKNTAPASLSWCRDQASLAVGSRDGFIHILESSDLELRCMIDTGGDGLYALAWAEDQQWIAVGDTNGRIRLWDQRGDRATTPMRELGRHRMMITDLAWRPRKGKTLAASSADGVLRLWRAWEDGWWWETEQHCDAILSVAWSPDGMTLATGADDHTVRIWKPEQSASGRALRDHGASVIRVSFSSNGERLATLSAAGQLLVWDCRTWKPVAEQWLQQDKKHYHQLDGGLACAPKGSRVACASRGDSGMIELHDLGIGAGIEEGTTSGMRQADTPGPHIESIDEDPTAPEAESTRILHLSDLHFRAGESPHTKIGPLITDLDRNLGVASPNYVVISGDMVNEATPEEFEVACNFVRTLLKELAVQRGHCILTPGNHDLAWNALTCRHACHKPSGIADHEYACTCERGKGHLVLLHSNYETRFRNFSECLYEPLMGREYPPEFGEQCIITPVGNDGIQFIAYNSAWRIDSCHSGRADIHLDARAHAHRILRPSHAVDGGCVSGSEQRAAGSMDHDAFRIAVWHHPVDSYPDPIGQEFLDHLYAVGIRLGLHGHTHRIESDPKFYRNQLLPLGTGSFGAPRADRPESMPVEYQLLELSPDRRILTARSRGKASDRAEWEAFAGRFADDGAERTPAKVFAWPARIKTGAGSVAESA